MPPLPNSFEGARKWWKRTHSHLKEGKEGFVRYIAFQTTNTETHVRRLLMFNTVKNDQQITKIDLTVENC